MQNVVSCNLCNNEVQKTIFIKNGFKIVQCSSCRLVYIGNPPSEMELRKLYSFDSNYHAKFQVNSPRIEREELKLAKQHNDFVRKYKTKGSILDIGCSAGFFLKVAKEIGWKTCGIEISDDTAQIARHRYGLEVLTGTIEETGITQGSFDVVTMWDLIEHARNPMKTMLNVNKVLKDEGLLFLSTPNVDGLFPKISYKVSKIINYWQHPEPPWHLFQFSKKTIIKLLELTGFIPLEMAYGRGSIQYTFGSLKSLFRSPKRLLYSIVFAPVMLFGPVVNAGDIMIIAAKKQVK